VGTWEPMTGAHVCEPFYHTVEADKKSVACRQVVPGNAALAGQVLPHAPRQDPVGAEELA